MAQITTSPSTRRTKTKTVSSKVKVTEMLQPNENYELLPAKVFFEAVRQAPIAISITDPQANILYANPACEQVSGYSVGELIGCNESTLSDKNTPRALYQQLWDALQNKQAWNGVLLNRRKDDSSYLADLTVAPLLDAEGNTQFYLGIHRDVSKLHELESKLNNQKAFIESVVDAVPVAIALLDLNGKELLANQAYKRLADEIENPAQRLLLGISGFDLKNFNNFNNLEVNYDIGKGYEPRWFSCSGIRVNEQETSVVNYFEAHEQPRLLFVAHEITNMKRQQEQARMQAVRALMAEQQMVQGIREAISGSIFQLRGLLNVSVAALQTLQRRGENSSMRAVLQQIEQAGTQALETLRFALPRETIEPSCLVNLNQVVRNVLEISTDRLLSQGVTVDWQPEPVLPSLQGREQQLHSVIKHLIDNALCAIEEPNTRKRDIHLRTYIEGHLIGLEITDSGQGVPEHLQLRIFEPFFTAWKRKGRHAGMGLAVTREIIAQHLGDIEIDRRYQEGCRFRVLLPISSTF